VTGAMPDFFDQLLKAVADDNNKKQK